MVQPTLNWLPGCDDFRASLKILRASSGSGVWSKALALANHRLDFVQTNALDSVLQQLIPPEHSIDGVPVVRLAILGSSTVTHLHPGIRVAGLRRGLRIITYEADYGQFRQELLDPTSGLYRFKPDTILFAFDAHYLSSGVNAAMTPDQVDALLEDKLGELKLCWEIARTKLDVRVLQQTPLPILPDLLGSNEHRLAGSPAIFIDRINARLPSEADQAGVHLSSIDRRSRREGIEAWHDLALWHRSKQEISLRATPVYGELVVRLISALLGRSYKALVLDLDNTIWGGVIGDDGLAGIVLGQGSATGEAFAGVQQFASALSTRGVILAVCSKNDESVAAQAFAEHPEMVLKRSQITSFVANWTDKAANIRRIAAEINIGLDSLVFLDDNPFERSLVRQELPMVAVPEVPEDPALVPQCLADAGYFESVAITVDDLERTRQYQLNQGRQALAATATDMDSYLGGLEMRLQWSRFDLVGLQRTVQLINKTNQFNLTTRRYGEDKVRAVIDDRSQVGLQLRLIDRFGDNGIIAIVIGCMQEEDLWIDTWLMSCRVLGRQVEQATLAVVLAEAERLGARSVIGEYIPTTKNGMVRDHYEKLEFTNLSGMPGEASTYQWLLGKNLEPSNFIKIEEV